jgi:hypothetical protein
MAAVISNNVFSSVPTAISNPETKMLLRYVGYRATPLTLPVLASAHREGRITKGWNELWSGLVYIS